MPKITYPYNGEVVSKCGGCPAMIYFYKHPGGKSIPVLFATKEPHFADCPAAKTFRKPKEGKQGELL